MEPSRPFSVGTPPGRVIRVGGDSPIFLIAGPCVIESEGHATMMAERLAAIASDLGVSLIFKASYDKANRSSVSSYRGPGLDEGLRILAKIKKRTGLPILTDVHEISHVGPAAKVCDVLQVPAFLSRQTDLLISVGRSGRVVNIKKGQFLSPWDIRLAAEKVSSTGNEKIILTERGTSFGYQNLVVDMRSFPIMRKLGYPVVFDVTHSVQLPGGAGESSGGQPEFIEPLARAGAASFLRFTTIRPRPFPTARMRSRWVSCGRWFKKSCVFLPSSVNGMLPPQRRRARCASCQFPVLSAVRARARR
jgi:2-dehydro-3-deoxyphosphooctonate aldolase (KDO 8-P synthase)